LFGKKLPLHCFIAATADDLRIGVIVRAVNGASCVVIAIHRERKALNVN
jgi:hypothetical protein